MIRTTILRRDSWIIVLEHRRRELPGAVSAGIGEKNEVRAFLLPIARGIGGPNRGIYIYIIIVSIYHPHPVFAQVDGSLMEPLTRL